MKSLSSFLAWLLLLCAPAQFGGMLAGHGQPGYANCVVPGGATNHWAASNSSNQCGTAGGSSCTSSGQAVYSIADSIAGDTATQTSAAAQPAYTPGAINGLPAWTFGGSGSTLTYFTAAAGIPASPVGASNTYAFVAKVNSVTTNEGILGTNVVTGGWDYRLSSGQQYVGTYGVGQIGLGSTVWSANTWYTFVMTVTYNGSSSSYAFYRCAGGTCSADGSGSSSVYAPTANVSTITIGEYNSTTYLTGELADLMYFNSIGAANLTAIAAWSQCRYGI